MRSSRSGHGPFLYARPVPPSEAHHRGIGVVCSLYAIWGSRYRCLPECRNPRKRLDGKDHFLGEGLDPKETHGQLSEEETRCVLGSTGWEVSLSWCWGTMEGN